jgi:hypothetical protein
MLLTIAFSHRDISQAARLLRWMQALDRGPQLLKQRGVLLVASGLARSMDRIIEVADAAIDTFGYGYLHVVDFPTGEPRYPHCSNIMFQESLLHARKHFNEDVLWIEPDAVPTTRDWILRIESEFNAHGKPFLGNLVTMSSVPHMTGNAIYRRDWEEYAPSILKATHEAWDTFCAPEILQHYARTNLIQHVWRQPRITLAMLDRNAVIFHQDKTSRMIRFLDQDLFGGELFRGKSDIIDDRYDMTKFYHTTNASLRRRAGGYEFRFGAYDMVGGAMSGVLALESDGEQAAMAMLSNDPRTGVTEIAQEEYERCSKKKHEPRNALKRSEGFSVGNRPLARSPAALVTPASSQSHNPALADPPREEKPVAATVAEAIQTAEITPSQPPSEIQARRKPGRPRKNPEPQPQT